MLISEKIVDYYKYKVLLFSCCYCVAEANL